MDGNKKAYETPKAEKLEFDYVNTVVASGKNPGLCGPKNPGNCKEEYGDRPGMGCSTEGGDGNPGNETIGGTYKTKNNC